MNNKNVVTVVANKNGEVVTISPNNAEFGWMQVESIQPTFQQGFLRLGKRVAFVAGKVSDLTKYVGDLSLVAGSEIPGKIVIREGLTPVSKEDSAIGIKYPNNAAKVAGLACTIDDQPIYRKVLYTPDIAMQDELLTHDNGVEIKEFISASNAALKTA